MSFGIKKGNATITPPPPPNYYDQQFTQQSYSHPPSNQQGSTSSSKPNTVTITQCAGESLLRTKLTYQVSLISIVGFLLSYAGGMFGLPGSLMPLVFSFAVGIMFLRKAMTDRKYLENKYGVR